MNLPELIALKDYTAPTMPPEHIFRAGWNRLKRRVAGPEDPLLKHSGLQHASLAVMNDLADPPDSGHLTQALDAQLGDWSREVGPKTGSRLLITPPCDSVGLMSAWAHAHGHCVLSEPSRIDITGPIDKRNLPDLSGDGLLVIPRLEHWFLRERNGLHALRTLLSQLASTQRKCLIGCDSWAWHFIVKSADAETALPQPETFEPYDARRLRDWFTRLARDSAGVTATFRLAGSGEDVLACDNDGEPTHAYLRQLAATSGGIPWVAWRLWRAGLKIGSGETSLSERATKAIAGDKRTIWIVEVDDIALRSSNKDRALLVLHALLIHNGLSRDELNAVLPTTGEPDMLPALVKSGHVRCDPQNGHHMIRPAAYPSVRQALQAAGFPMGAL